MSFNLFTTVNVPFRFTEWQMPGEFPGPGKVPLVKEPYSRKNLYVDGSLIDYALKTEGKNSLRYLRALMEILVGGAAGHAMFQQRRKLKLLIPGRVRCSMTEMLGKYVLQTIGSECTEQSFLL